MIELPEILEPHRAAIEESLRPAVVLEPTAEPMVRSGTFLGGMPWWPANHPWPTTIDGDPLDFIAQLNLADLPRVQGFPQTGLLQFFCADIGWDYGANPIWSDGQPVRVVHREIVAGTDLLESPRELVDEPVVVTPTSIAGAVAWQGPMPGDVDFPHDFSQAEHDAWHDWSSLLSTHLGGYAFWPQQDPRTHDTTGERWRLVFQLYSPSEVTLGDSGVAQWLIRDDDLARGDFSRVRFSWGD